MTASTIGRWVWKRGQIARHHAYARVTGEEYAVITSEAGKAGLSVSDFVRRCINGYLLEQGDDVPLLTEHRRSARDAASGAYE